MESSKVIMTLRVRWKKRVKLAITLDPDDVEDVQDIGCNTGDNYVRLEMPFNSLMTEFFEGSNRFFFLVDLNVCINVARRINLIKDFNVGKE